MLGALAALLLAFRLLSPAGFMPAFDHGTVTIVACPDADAAASQTAPHHHHEPGTSHQQCPYAAGSTTGTFNSAGAIDVAHLITEPMMTNARGIAITLPRRAKDRPPLRGPPPQA